MVALKLREVVTHGGSIVLEGGERMNLSARFSHARSPLALPPGHKSGHRVPVCTQYLCVPGSSLLCSRSYAHVSKWLLTERNGVTIYTVTLKV